MNARFLSISLSVAAFVVMASADAWAQGRGGGMGGGGMGGSMGRGGMGGMQGGGMPSDLQRSIDSAPGQRQGDAQDRGRSANAERQAPAAAQQGQNNTPQDLLTQNPRLADNVSKLLPAGTDLQAAAAGFGNLGEFVSAVHVSNNLGIPFSDLKTRVLAGDSLGTAIHALKPEADAQVEVRKARARADELTKG